MENINCEIKIDIAKRKILLKHLKPTDMEIDCSEDVNFTELVSVLAEKIDLEQTILCDIDNITDDVKMNLVIETIEEILKKFNNTVSPKTDGADDEDAEFWNPQPTKQKEEDNDLPF